jgi:site-specific DNA-cytosine methylase
MEPEGLISFGRRRGGYHGEVVDTDAPSKTIICTYTLCPRLFVGLRSAGTWIRTLSVRELAQIQGFPADYPWQGGEKAAITQIGNAVPPALATFVGLALGSATMKRVAQVSESAAADSDEE